MKLTKTFHCNIIILATLSGVKAFAADINMIAGGDPVPIAITSGTTGTDQVCLGPVQQSSTTNIANVVGFSFYSRNYPNNNLQCSGMADWVCLDNRYCGIPINLSTKTIILVPEGNIESTFGVNYDNLKVSGSVNFTGKTPIATNKAIWDGSKACFSQADYPKSYYVGSAPRTVSFNSSLKWSLYVGKDALSRKYPISNIYIANPLAASCISEIYSAEDVVNVIKPITCSISPPSPIKFGQVNLNGATTGKALAHINGSLKINCTGEVSSKTAKIQVTGNTGSNSDTLKLNWDNVSATDKIPAEIKGFIGNTVPSGGQCNGKAEGIPNYIVFDSSQKQSISINKLVPGINSVPYNFSLCSTGESSFGSANAQAVVNVDWD